MVSVKVDEFDLGAVQVGDEVLVRVTSLNKEIKGTISSISKEGQIISGVTYFIAEVDLEADDTLKVGMSTEITLLAKESLGVVTLPMEAISFETDNTPYVLKAGVDGAVLKESITTGISDGMKVEILTGVSKDETVLYKKAAAAGFGPGMGGRIGGDNEGGGN
jgi:HlyD family secretion protein